VVHDKYPVNAIPRALNARSGQLGPDRSACVSDGVVDRCRGFGFLLILAPRQNSTRMVLFGDRLLGLSRAPQVRSLRDSLLPQQIGTMNLALIFVAGPAKKTREGAIRPCDA